MPEHRFWDPFDLRVRVTWTLDLFPRRVVDHYAWDPSALKRELRKGGGPRFAVEDLGRREIGLHPHWTRFNLATLVWTVGADVDLDPVGILNREGDQATFSILRDSARYTFCFDRSGVAQVHADWMVRTNQKFQFRQLARLVGAVSDGFTRGRMDHPLGRAIAEPVRVLRRAISNQFPGGEGAEVRSSHFDVAAARPLYVVPQRAVGGDAHAFFMRQWELHGLDAPDDNAVVLGEFDRLAVGPEGAVFVVGMNDLRSPSLEGPIAVLALAAAAVGALDALNVKVREEYGESGDLSVGPDHALQAHVEALRAALHYLDVLMADTSPEAMARGDRTLRILVACAQGWGHRTALATAAKQRQMLADLRRELQGELEERGHRRRGRRVLMAFAMVGLMGMMALAGIGALLLTAS